MTALTDTAENNWMKLFFQNIAWSGIADPAASGNITTYYIGFHKGDPGETGSLGTPGGAGAEAAYAGYSRGAVLRQASGNGFGPSPLTGNTANPLVAINAGTCTAAGSESSLPISLTHFSLNSASTGGVMYCRGALSPAISVNAGVTPQLSISTTFTAD